MSSVELRAWSVDDAAWYANVAAHDEQIQRFTSESPELTEAEVAAAIAALLAGPPDQAGFLIADAATGERLGNIALEIKEGAGHVSYWLAAPARGRGAATEALKLLSRWAFDHLDLAELRLWAHADNAASRAVAERAGYVRDPGRDDVKQIKGRDWPCIAYRLVPS